MQASECEPRGGDDRGHYLMLRRSAMRRRCSGCWVESLVAALLVALVEGSRLSRQLMLLHWCLRSTGVTTGSTQHSQQRVAVATRDSYIVNTSTLAMLLCTVWSLRSSSILCCSAEAATLTASFSSSSSALAPVFCLSRLECLAFPFGPLLLVRLQSFATFLLFELLLAVLDDSAAASTTPSSEDAGMVMGRNLPR